jgi:Galactokinase
MATSAQLRREILAGQWDEALSTLYGTEPAVLARQRQRYAAALEQFELYYGPGRQVHVYSAPGRAELGGNHTDHQHGYGLAAAVTLDLVAVASPSDDGFIRVKSRGFNKLDVIDLSEAEPQQGESTHSASLIRGIAEGFRAQGKTVGGFDAYTASDVLRGSGLSSSAAFEMGMASILNGDMAAG